MSSMRLIERPCTNALHTAHRVRRRLEKRSSVRLWPSMFRQQCGTLTVCRCARLRVMYDVSPYVAFTVCTWLATALLRHTRRWGAGRSLRSAVRSAAAHLWWRWHQVAAWLGRLLHPRQAARARTLRLSHEANADWRFFHRLNQAVTTTPHRPVRRPVRR